MALRVLASLSCGVGAVMDAMAVSAGKSLFTRPRASARASLSIWAFNSGNRSLADGLRARSTATTTMASATPGTATSAQ
jgi:hypothetical protein